MKQLLLATLIFCSQTLIAQTWEWGLNYSNQTPRGSMSDNINAAHGYATNVGYRLPIFRKKLVTSLEFGSGRYGKERVSQTFQSDLVTTPTDFMVNYINFSNFSHLNLRYEFTKNKKFTPYVMALGGRQTMGTRVRINVMEDAVGGGDDCAPLEDEVTFRKREMVWGYGAGVMMRIPATHQRFSSCDEGILINFSVTSVQGGAIDYVNVKQLKQVNPATPPANDGSKEWAVPFINLNTNNIHNHTIARVYNSPLQQLQFRLGIIFRFAD